jgi:pyrroline-5-carboxylate reductase
MGGAIIRGVVKTEAINSQDVKIFARDAKDEKTAFSLGVNSERDSEKFVKDSDVIILAVKPKDAKTVLKNFSKYLDQKAILSIVAGLGYSGIIGALNHVDRGCNARVLVGLPNTPVMAGEGVIAFTNETNFTDEEKSFVQKLFEQVAMVEWIDEVRLPGFAAVSGSGPAFAAIFAEALADGAVLHGLNRQTAYRIAYQTLKGSGAVLLSSPSPSSVKDGVCSPGGTTIEGVKALEESAFRGAVMEAVNRAAQKFNALN